MEFSKKEFFEHSWAVIEKYFGHNKGYQLIKHLLDSYNDFALRKLDNIIDGFNPIEIHHQFLPELDQFKYTMSIEVKNPIISKPMIHEKDGSTKLMTPMDGRNRNFTYTAPLYVEVHVKCTVFDEETKETMVDQKKISNVCLGKIPIMVNSKYCILHDNKAYDNECPYDYGGYFIVNGNEKVIISQDRIAENKTYVFLSNKPGPYSHVAEIRSVQENKFSVPKTTSLKLSAKPNQFGRFIRANIHHIKHDIPIFVLFRALGVETDKDIVNHVVYDVEDPDNQRIMNELTGSVEEANTVSCTREAFEYLSRHMNINGYPREILNNKQHRLEILKNVLRHEFLPHCGTTFAQKALYLGYMVNKLIKCYLGLLPYDDRDSYINKRIDTPGILLANLFRQCYGKVIKDMKNAIQKDINTGSWRATNRFKEVINKVNIAKLMKSTTIESALKYGLATGNWGIKNKAKAGVAQVLNRMTYNASLSHLRRINTPIEKTGKLVQPRKLHSTQWGIICPAECFDPETPILMWDGIVRKAQDITVGDYLIDDNGNSVRVKSTCSGFKTMYEIIPDKDNFMSYTVTDNHILTLKVKKYKVIRNHRGKKELSWFDKQELKYNYKDFDNKHERDTFYSSLDDDNVIDITIEKYLSLPKGVQKNLYMFKCQGINWEHKYVALDPYILGMWLGDGQAHGYGFATADMELRNRWIEWGKDNDATITKGYRYSYTISSTINNTQPGISCNKTEAAPLKKLLKKYGLINNKHIPMDYLVNDRKTRLAVLAGLVDTDGHVRANGHEIRICQGERNYRIIEDAEFLARSLGFSCHVNNGICSYTVKGEKRRKPYKELSITGPKLYEIPTILPRKKLNRFDDPVTEKRCFSFLQSSFKMVKKDVQPFVGWQLEGNGRFLLGDMSISHNTPEGISVGLVKNMSLISNVTISSNSTSLRERLKDTDIVMYDGTNILEFGKGTKVVVNGDIIGVSHKPNELYDTIKMWKRRGMINIYSGVYWNINRKEIWVCTEGGRCVRPCFIVENNNVNISATLMNKLKRGDIGFNELVIGDSEFPPIIEYLDVEECNQAMIAMKYADLFKGMKGSTFPIRYTHIEMDPSLMLGVLAASIPFSNHNQAPRNTYQSAMGKQAIGIYTSNYLNRYDTLGHVLNYPQIPFVQTRASKIVNNDKLPCGINVIVAIACWSGYNQEDSVIMNKSSVDRGMFGSTYYRTYKEQNNKNHSTGEEEYFCKPDPKTTKQFKPFNYDKLNKDGFVEENTHVESGDIIIGKCMPQKTGNIISNKDTSVVLKNNEKGFIDRNSYGDKYFTNINGDGYTFAKVRIRSDRVPCIGDKFCLPGACEVLTEQGWIKIEQLANYNCNIRVAQLDADGLIDFVHPTGSFVFDHDGDMYQAKGKHVDIMTTMEHKMYVRVGSLDAPPKLVMAKDLAGRRVYYVKDGLYNSDFANVNNGIVCPNFGIQTIEDCACVLGVWMRRGWCEVTNMKAVIASLNKEYYDKITRIMVAHCVPFTSKLDAVVVDSTNMYSYLDGCQSNVQFPFWLETNAHVARAFVDALMQDDETIVLGKERADHLCILALYAGYSADIISNSHRAYTVRVNRSMHVDTSDYVEEIVHYSGKVYCIEVPSHVFYVRYNGHTMWTGNSSRHGQKGTVGMLYRQEDMPFTANGITPDIIVNPHAIPSRMTIAQLMECIMGKACAALGTFGDATPFTDLKVEDIASALEHAGLERYGNEVMYNSRTGEQMPTAIFIGPTYYQRLKHMVDDKVHSRAANGPVVMLTRQPAEGRARDGGLRLGEMEIECNWAHGTMQFLKERFMECSDNYRVFVCKKCGMMANVNPDKGVYNCKSCKNITHFSEIRIPYSCKLLFQEIQTMGIAAKFLT